MRGGTVFILFFSLLLFLQTAFAGADIYHFASQQESQRFRSLTKELRCLVCENQSLADSDAALAKDLRNKIYGLMQERKSDAEIREFLVSRYGKFVLFSPPFMTSTFLLWTFPALLLAGIFGTLFFRSRRNPVAASVPSSLAGED